MYISVDDLKLLKSILYKIEEVKPHDFHHEYVGLYILIMKLSEQRDMMNERTRITIAERRKIDKNYARKKR